VSWRFEFVSIESCADVDGPAVVVDVLRAFSFAACAFSVGAAELLLARELDEALELKRRIAGAVACKDGAPTEGFEFSNSPAAVLGHDLTGRVVIQRTAAGTQGTLAARGCQPLYCVSFLTAKATVASLQATLVPQSLAFVITGDAGHADEDLACGEYVAALLDDPDTDAAPFVARAAASDAAADLQAGLERRYRGIHKDDVAICLDADRFAFAMTASDSGTHVSLRAHT
jgi:2-phosphosulfolactate phosphatase